MSWYNDFISLEGCQVLVTLDNGNQVIGFLDKNGQIPIKNSKIQPFIIDKKSRRSINSGIQEVELRQEPEHDPSEWYRNLSWEGLKGKHVAIISEDMPSTSGIVNNTVIHGRLNGFGEIEFAHSNGIKVFYYIQDHMEKGNGIGSVKLIWDEKDYLIVPIKELRERDRVVINDRLYIIQKIESEPSQGVIEYILQREGYTGRTIMSKLPVDYGLRHVNY